MLNLRCRPFCRGPVKGKREQHSRKNQMERLDMEWTILNPHFEMKKIILTFITLFSWTINLIAADSPTIVAPTSTVTNNFVLYPTANIYTFLKLDTRNGKIWQVQYAMDENEFEVVLNDKPLVYTEKAGQFTLYPTTNNWTFLLLDTVNGDVWHVQWSQDAYSRGIIPIKSLIR